MARVYTSGAETGSLKELTSAFGVTVSSSIKRSGSYSYNVVSSSGSSGGSVNFSSSDITNGTYYLRGYIYISSVTSVSSPPIVLGLMDSGGSVRSSIQLNSNRTLRLANSLNQQVGSASAVLALNTWYRIELKMAAVTSGSSGEVRGYIDGVEFAGSSSTSSGPVGIFTFGLQVYTSTASIFVDDIALNDSNNSFQNSFPGESSVIILRPNAAGDSSQLTATGATPNYVAVSEIDPNDATNYVSGSSNGLVDDYNITDSGIGSGTINCLDLNVRWNASGTSGVDQMRFRIKGSSGGSVVETNNLSPNNTTWRTNAPTNTFSSNLLNPFLVSYTNPNNNQAWTSSSLDAAQIGIKVEAAGISRAQVSTIWLNVDYVPGAPVTPTYTGTFFPFF